MATIDYKEKYEKAVQAAMLAKQGTESAVTIGILEEIFPELREPEDERMIKFIKQQLFNIKKTITENYELDAKLTKAIEWLEKQGEQKPAWTEEDEKFLSDIIKDLVHPWNEYIPDRIEDEIEWLKNRLKSIKNRVQPQPKQEWSKEDKYNHNIILYLLNNECVGVADKRIAIEWFKSLKDRYTWKPSDEQMKALSAINVTGNISYAGQGQELINLFSDLKKLKE